MLDLRWVTHRDVFFAFTSMSEACRGILACWSRTCLFGDTGDSQQEMYPTDKEDEEKKKVLEKGLRVIRARFWHLVHTGFASNGDARVYKRRAFFRKP